MIGENNYRKDRIYFFGNNFSSINGEASKIEIFMNKIFIEGIELQASDIHIECFSDYFKVRYRVDGILIEKGRYPLKDNPSLVSRVKILCNLDIAEKRMPQDGRVNARYNDEEFDFRISIVPTYFGEKVVIRILNQSTPNKSLKELGFDKEYYSKLFEIIKRKSGMLIISGPMGSGKTTSLYAILKEINTTERNIITIEDPIEYLIEGVNQIQCKPNIGLTFAKILKSILRQDADVIMIGEIRDKETAEIAIKASLTGHLILSTLHTRNTASAIKRLINLGIEPYMISSGVRGIQSQRLVRRLCPYCKQEDKDYKNKLKMLNLPENAITSKIYTHSKCEKCNNTGYLGRILVGEFMYIDSNIESYITAQNTTSQLEEELKKYGIKTLIENGLELVTLGDTSLDEIIREC